METTEQEDGKLTSVLPDVLDEVLRKNHAEMLSHLNTWLATLEAKLDGQHPNQQLPKIHLTPAPSNPSSPTESFSELEARNLRFPSMRGHRANTPDSYQVAQQVGQSISEAFMKLGSHSQDMALSVRNVSGKVQQITAMLANSQCMGIFWAFVIMTNSIYLGVQLEWSAREKSLAASPGFTSVHVIYATLFTIEALINLIGSGWTQFLCGESWHWNWLDIFVVSSSWIELAIDLLTPGEAVSRSNSNFRLARLLRIGRLARVVRIVRVVRLFRALRTLVYSLLGTLKSLFWSFLLLGLIMYIFGILFTDLALQHVLEGDDTEAEDLERYFGTLYASVSTLFRSISNGLTWHHAADSLEPTGMFWIQVFHFYVAFCSFALLNVMTGVFCNSAIKAAERDHDTVLQTLLQTRHEYKLLVEQLFRKIDTRGLGHVTISEFESHFDDPVVRAFFDYLQVGAVDAWTLFVGLDKDGDHTITAEEFVDRCVQLHGPARSADLFAMKLNAAKLSKQIRQVVEAQGRMESYLSETPNFHV